MELQINGGYSEERKAWQVRLMGEVDVSTADKLRELLGAYFKEKPADIILDIMDLAYIDSTGLGVLIGAYGRMQEKGFGIRIEHPRDNIAKLLRITSLDKIFCPAE